MMTLKCPGEFHSQKRRKFFCVRLHQAVKRNITELQRQYSRLCKEDLKPLSSYHLKTLFLHLRRESPQARSDDSNLGESVVKFFARLIDRLKGGHLPHFFVGPRVDLFSELSGRTRTNLACKLEYFLNKLVENSGEVSEQV